MCVPFLLVIVIADSSSSSSHRRLSPVHREDDSPFVLFPKTYDKSYRISFSVMTDDLAYRLRQLQQRREDDGRRSMEIERE